MMRMILIVGLAAGGIGLAGTSGASAAPANPAVINDLATTTDHVTPVRLVGHWRWGSRGYYHRRWDTATAVIGDGVAVDGGGGKLLNLRLADGRSVQLAGRGRGIGHTTGAFRIPHRDPGRPLQKTSRAMLTLITTLVQALIVSGTIVCVTLLPHALRRVLCPLADRTVIQAKR